MGEPIRFNGIHIEDRDLSLLAALFETRLMTTADVQQLFFAGNYETAKKRLQKLKRARVLTERKGRGVYGRSILHLTVQGFRILQTTTALHDNGYPPISEKQFKNRAAVAESTLNHELDVMKVKTAILSHMSPSEQFSVIQFSTWPVLYRFMAQATDTDRAILFNPDGFIRIHDTDPPPRGSMHVFFLEVDRATESLSRIAEKAMRYQWYYGSGGLGQRFNVAKGTFYQFWVLFVASSERRRNNMAQVILQNHKPIKPLFRMTTQAEIEHNPLGSIWLSLMEYERVTNGTPFDPFTLKQRGKNNPGPEREQLIRPRIKKTSLLSE